MAGKKSSRSRRAGAKKTTKRKAVKRGSRAKAPEDALASEAHGHSEFELSGPGVETALQTGEHAGLLEDYFGPEEYAELRQLARDVAARRGGGPRVWILPGIMGSTIGKKKALLLFDDVYWLDPIDIGLGRLRDLALGARKKFEALGVILFAYLKLKLRLRRAGYEAEFFPFDWRQSITHLGAELKKALAKVDGDVFLVAHSMGGLVARSALGQGGKCKSLVMLGTPNFGSFAPVMALRAVYPVVRKVAWLDVKHSPEQLARDVFSTFPGLTQMLPAPDHFSSIDFYDRAQWPDPASGLCPHQDILDGVAGMRALLRKANDGVPMSLIAGINQETVVSAALDPDPAKGFTYTSSLEGDGTVPLAFAQLPGAKTYYIDESHGSLPNNGLVAAAVLDLLDRGETSRLPDTHVATTERAVRKMTDAELRVDPYEATRGRLLSQRELRELLSELAAPSARSEATSAPDGDVAPPSVAASQPGYVHRFDRVVVGRRRQHRIDLRFARGSITETDARAIALGIFPDVAPGGAAGALDRQLGGAITELTRRRMFSGQVGEVFMMPTGRHQLRADHIAFVGLGPFDRFTEDVLQTAAENLMRTFIGSRIEEFATVVYGGASGQRPADGLRNLLVGLLRGLQDADRDHHFRRIVVCERDEARYTELKEELLRLSSTELCADVELTFDEVVLPPPPSALPLPVRLRSRTQPVYLIVRQERAASGRIDVRSSLLTYGDKATVVTDVARIQTAEFDEWRKKVATQRTEDFTRVGSGLAQLLLAGPVQQVLPRFRNHHLVVVHDAPMSRVPWETLAFDADDGTWFPAAEKGLSHRYAADNLSVAKWLEQRIEDGVLNVLLVVNPTEDLPGAEREGKRIEQLFKSRIGCQLEILRRGRATRPALLSAFASGHYDVIHYAGHAFFDEANPEQSGIVCHDHVHLTGADLAGLGNLPTLVFFNACEAGRVREAASKRLDRVDSAVGLAEAFMRGGVANFVGTYWPVGDAPAAAFAGRFYDDILHGHAIGEALQAARNVVRTDEKSKDWANYIFYGNADFVLKEGAAERGEG